MMLVSHTAAPRTSSQYVEREMRQQLMSVHHQSTTRELAQRRRMVPPPPGHTEMLALPAARQYRAAPAERSDTRRHLFLYGTMLRNDYGAVALERRRPPSFCLHAISAAARCQQPRRPKASIPPAQEAATKASYHSSARAHAAADRVCVAAFFIPTAPQRGALLRSRTSPSQQAQTRRGPSPRRT